MFLAWAVGFGGCQREEGLTGPEAERRPITLTGSIDQLAVSRVNDDGFCDGDVIGVYISDYVGSTPGTLTPDDNRASNVRFTFNEAAYKWTGAYDVYWRDDHTPIDVYGYYPHGTPESIEAYPFAVAKDQSKAAENGELGGYEASDFLWGKAEKVAPTTPIIRLSFKHKMACVRVTLAEGEGFAAGEWAGLEKSVLVVNTTREATINLATGVVTPVGDAATTGTIPYKRDNDFRAIVVPQTVKAGTKLFKITVDGVVYHFAKEGEDFTYIPSKMSNFTIRVDKKAATGTYTFTLAGESVTPWEADAVTHDASTKEYIVIHSTAGHLRDSITAAGKDYRELQNLKVTGEICGLDFMFMRDSMAKLTALNLKEVKIKGGRWEVPNSGGLIDYFEYEEDKIPHNAFDQKKSLQRLVLPDKLNVIGSFAFNNCTSLAGSLLIPEGVTEIEWDAFNHCYGLMGSLTLPSTLKKIGTSAFSNCQFICELRLPEQLIHIDGSAFYGCSGFYGNLILPDNLEYLGGWAFAYCSGFIGNLVIPQKITSIYGSTFQSCLGLNGTLTLPDGISIIEEQAFMECPFRGELVLPNELRTIESSAFMFSQFSGTLKLPEKLTIIGGQAFSGCSRLSGVLEIPKSVLGIGARAFQGCDNIEGIILPENLESIASDAFGCCFNISSIVCKNPIPPTVLSGAFNGVPKDNFTLEVPESAVEQYRAAPGWSEFKRIAAHRELVCRPAFAEAINAETKRTLVLNAESDWVVDSIPAWCTLSAMSGSKKTELTLTLHELPKGSADRSGYIVFRLTGKDYTHRCRVVQYNYDAYDENEVVTLQEHTAGNGVNLVFLGDGFNAEEVANGTYLTTMKEQVERFFDIEPYRTYRDYFNVYTAIAVSPESGIGTVNTIRYTKFETTFTGGVGLKCDYDATFAYTLAMNTSVTRENLNQSLIIMTPNSTDYGGICQMWADGSAIAFCPLSDYGYPMDSRGVIQHEAGGHGFGKLGDEYIYHNAFIDFCDCTCCGHVDAVNWAKSLGWYENLSLTGKMHEVPWSHLIFHEKYSDIVDVFEGGYMHNRGVYRSEQNSCMNNDIPYYSTISREAIVRRILTYAGEEYTFEKFVAKDSRDATVTAKSTTDKFYPGVSVRRNHQMPRIHPGKPNVLK